MGLIAHHGAQWRLLAVLAALGIAEDAWAAGFQLREQSAEGLGNAYAGATAKASDPSTIFYNPAGMTRLEGNQASMSATWIAPVAKFKGENTTVYGATSGGQGGDAINDAAVAAGYAMFSISPDWKFGVALTAPFGLSTEYKSDWVGRYQTIKSEIININVTPSVAYRVNDRLSIGGGVQFGYAESTLTKAINVGGILGMALGSPVALPLEDGQSAMTGNGLAAGFDLGLLYEFAPTTRLGVNWRSQMTYTLKGDIAFGNIPAMMAAALPNGSVKADVTLPDTVTIGFYHEISPQWAVMADIAWTNWSTFDEIRIKYTAIDHEDLVTTEDWKDTWFYSLGLTYKLDDKNRFQFGVAYDGSPVDIETRRAGIPDANRYWLSTGYTYTMNPKTSFNIAYAHIFCDSVAIHEGDANSAAGLLTGEYSGHVDIVSAGFVSKF
jgi:long-chain fatty acid transport protein